MSTITAETGNAKWSKEGELTFSDALRLPASAQGVQVTYCDALNACTLTPQYSLDGGTTWLSMDTDLEVRVYGETVGAAARPKLPKTFLLAGGITADDAEVLFRLYSSVAQTSKGYRARVWYGG